MGEQRSSAQRVSKDRRPDETDTECLGFALLPLPGVSAIVECATPLRPNVLCSNLTKLESQEAARVTSFAYAQIAFNQFRRFVNLEETVRRNANEEE